MQHVFGHQPAIFRSRASKPRFSVSGHGALLHEQPDVVARGAGIGIGGASLCFRAASQIYQDHALVRPAPCDIHWNHADGTHEQHGPPNLNSDCISSDEHFRGCSTDLRDAEGSFSSSVFHLSTSALTWRGAADALCAGRAR